MNLCIHSTPRLNRTGNLAGKGLLAILSLTALPVTAQREPVLKQIDLPHRYYYREMYLPQLTTGPSSAAWSSDSRSLIYSMNGTLWRQPVNSGIAEQLTSGPGYDYQPDCSPDGRWVIYVKYRRDAMELWALDLKKKESHPITSGGAVNVEPRFSPDGKRFAFVSTSYHKRFHIFVADFNNAEPTGMQRLTGESRSNLPRFYYSEFDHEISPTWSPDGADLIFVSNRGHIYGTGGFWRMKAEPNSEPRAIHYEETTWKARPDFSPDDKRIVYGSYLGGQWHQLWVMPANGGDAFPITYGDFDNINPRWSPDGKRIAFISNNCPSTCLVTQEIPGGAPIPLPNPIFMYLKPMGSLSLTVLDSTGRPTQARVFVTGEDARAYAPRDAWMHSDDNFDRSERPFEAHYFHANGTVLLDVPVGKVTVEAMKGFEYGFEKQTVQIVKDQQTKLIIRLKPIEMAADHSRWVSGDVHVHMNYAGTYRNWPRMLASQAEAEGLDIVENLIVNKEQRIPDVEYIPRIGIEDKIGRAHV